MVRAVERARRFRAMTRWGAVVLCASSVCCSGGGSLNPFKDWRTEPLVEATGVGALRIDEATVADAVKAFGVPTDNARYLERGHVELRTPLFRVSFVPPPDGQGAPRLYAVFANLRDDVYLGKTGKGIGFMDSADAMRAAYGPPDAVWVTLNDHIHFYQQGVIFTTRHPKEIPPALYEKALAATGKQPSEKPDSHVVTAIMVVRPFTVLKESHTVMARQQVISSRPETDLLVSPF